MKPLCHGGASELRTAGLGGFKGGWALGDVGGGVVAPQSVLLRPKSRIGGA